MRKRSCIKHSVFSFSPSLRFMDSDTDYEAEEAQYLQMISSELYQMNAKTAKEVEMQETIKEPVERLKLAPSLESPLNEEQFQTFFVLDRCCAESTFQRMNGDVRTFTNFLRAIGIEQPTLYDMILSENIQKFTDFVSNGPQSHSVKRRRLNSIMPVLEYAVLASNGLEKVISEIKKSEAILSTDVPDAATTNFKLTLGSDVKLGSELQPVSTHDKRFLFKGLPRVVAEGVPGYIEYEEHLKQEQMQRTGTMRVRNYTDVLSLFLNVMLKCGFELENLSIDLVADPQCIQKFTKYVYEYSNGKKAKTCSTKIDCLKKCVRYLKSKVMLREKTLSDRFQPDAAEHILCNATKSYQSRINLERKEISTLEAVEEKGQYLSLSEFQSMLYRLRKLVDSLKTRVLAGMERPVLIKYHRMLLALMFIAIPTQRVQVIFYLQREQLIRNDSDYTLQLRLEKTSANGRMGAVYRAISLPLYLGEHLEWWLDVGRTHVAAPGSERVVWFREDGKQVSARHFSCAVSSVVEELTGKAISPQMLRKLYCTHFINQLRDTQPQMNLNQVFICLSEFASSIGNDLNTLIRNYYIKDPNDMAKRSRVIGGISYDLMHKNTLNTELVKNELRFGFDPGLNNRLGMEPDVEATVSAMFTECANLGYEPKPPPSKLIMSPVSSLRVTPITLVDDDEAQLYTPASVQTPKRSAASRISELLEKQRKLHRKPRPVPLSKRSVQRLNPSSYESRPKKLFMATSPIESSPKKLVIVSSEEETVKRHSSELDCVEVESYKGKFARTIEEERHLATDEILDSESMWYSTSVFERVFRFMSLQFWDLGGLVSPLSLKNVAKVGDREELDKRCYVAHINGNHWIAITVESNVMKIYDSLCSSEANCSQELRRIVHWLARDRGAIRVFRAPMQQQIDGSSCGPLACAVCIDFALGLDPERRTWDVARLRAHIRECLRRGLFAECPQTAETVRRVPLESVQLNK